MTVLLVALAGAAAGGAAGLLVTRRLLSAPRWPRLEPDACCESCGARAEVQLDDGSTWCVSCDLTARRALHDNRRGRLL